MSNLKWKTQDTILHGQKKLEQEASIFRFVFLAKTFQTLTLVFVEALGVLAILELVFYRRGDINTDKSLLTRDTLLVGVDGMSTQSKGELLDVEGGQLGESGLVFFVTLCEKVHICLSKDYAN